MATLQDAATVVVNGTAQPNPTVETVTINVNAVTVTTGGTSSLVPSFDSVTITVPGQPSAVEINVPGPQGPPGVQNVFVQNTPPANPEVNWIWFDTT